MGRKAAELGSLAVSRLATPGMHFVGGVSGLALQVLPTGGRTWVLRAVIGGRRRDMGLGGYPDVTLAGAREAARAARAKIRCGIDPIEESRAARSQLKAARVAALTFAECAAKYIRAHAPSWRNEKHAAQWTSTLETYAYPVMGSLLVRDVGVAQVLAVLEPIWHTKPETEPPGFRGGRLVLVHERVHDLKRRSSSAGAKNALASFRISLARRSSRTSRSSSLTCCCSAVVAPSRRPPSRSPWRTQRRSVSAVQPIFAAIDSMPAHCDSYWSLASNTMRTARSITSGENFADFLMMAPSSQTKEPPCIFQTR